MRTHQVAIEKPSLADIQPKLIEIKKRINNEKPADIAAKLTALAEQLSEFELGRFLLKNNGAWSGFWTDYIITGHDLSQVEHPLEKQLLTEFHFVLTTRERYHIFQQQLQTMVDSNSQICDVPCGLMSCSLDLTFASSIKNISYVGFDLDESIFDLAKLKAASLQRNAEFYKRDAWQLNVSNEFDILTSNGLNIYEPSNELVIELYQQFYDALKPGGKLITSALTLPPGQTKPSEWDMQQINQPALETAFSVFFDVLGSSWASFRTSDETKQQLKQAGFKNIKTHWDRQKIFPTFTAEKI